jgi:hypothetical protein
VSALRARAVQIVLVLAGIAVASAAAAQKLHTNEAQIADAVADGALAVEDPLAVFAFVLNRLPAAVQVLPTENYYYFRFVRRGVPYAGNIRLAAADRDAGKVNFSYGVQPSDWDTEPAEHHMILDAAKGVAVARLAPLAYAVSLGGKTVRFALNDLSSARPPAGLLGPDERVLGPVYDESALRFFLVFNARLDVFHYLLDETAPVPDAFAPLPGSGRIVIGRRSGFAFFQDGGRKILVGVSARQSRLNTIFDGPFDQLPENFITSETLRGAILAVAPELAGRIDRLGNFADGSGRYLIHPYLLYRQPRDLAVFDRCVTSRRVRRAGRARCFVIDDDEAQRRAPRPLALKRGAR